MISCTITSCPGLSCTTSCALCPRFYICCSRQLSGPLRSSFRGGGSLCDLYPCSAFQSGECLFYQLLHMYLINLIKGGFCSPPHETFNLADISGDSQEGGTGATTVPDPRSPTPSCCQRRMEKRAEKAGTKQGKVADDTQRFFEVVNKKKMCTFCL